MATYAAYRHIELDKVGYSKKRVRNPSSEIFNVLCSPTSPENKSISNGIHHPRRASHHNDSFTRLFGSPESKRVAPRRASMSNQDVKHRNPVTGNGVISYDCRPLNRSMPKIHTERNPVTGEVYQIVSPATTPTKSVPNGISPQNGIKSQPSTKKSTPTKTPITNGHVEPMTNGTA